MLVFIFWVFFDRAKHDPVLSRICPFLEDPFDAVGSFAVQLAFFSAASSVIRAFARRTQRGVSEESAMLITRGWVVAASSIIAAMAADAIAMARFPSEWVGQPGGVVLVAIMAGITAGTAGLAAWTLRLVREKPGSPGGHVWVRAGMVSLLSAAVLALYPEAWRVNVTGALAAAAAGMSTLFLTAGVFAHAIFPPAAEPTQDLIDVIGATFRRRNTGAVHGNKRPSRVLRLLNPRVHPWAPVVVLGAAAGAALASMEALAEGGPADTARFMAVMGVFIGLEGLGVVQGYAIFRRFLGIVKREAAASSGP
jgi:hypothetical protein